VAVAAAALGAVAWLSVGRRDARPASTAMPATAARPNVLLVTIDTLRADALGCYGRVDAGTPVLDALATRGVRFETAIAPAPLTSPSHASILTGLLPVRHGVRDNGGYVLPDEVASVAEAFRRAGYRTAGFVSGFPLARRFGFARGLETFDDHFPRGNPRRAPYVERDAAGTTDVVLGWLGAGDPAPFFAWVHYYDPHAPYEAPPPFAERFRARPYQGEVAFVDVQLGRLLRRLGETGLAARTIVLVIADHGESLGEHGEETHGIFVYDATVRIPWILAGPGVPPRVVSRVGARVIDVAPTLLDLAGLPPLPGIDGRSLRPATTGDMRDEPAYVESLSPLLHLGWAPLHAWRTRRWKLIEAPRVELYDLVEDPREEKNVAAEHRDVVDEMRRPLGAAMAAPAPDAAHALDAETAERLSALGYLSGGPTPPSGEASSRRDPKDHARLLARLERGMSRFRADPAGAISDLTAVLDADPGIAIARRYRAIAQAGARRPEAALADLNALDKAHGLTADDLVIRADCLTALKRDGEALEALDRAAGLQPRSPQPWLSRARVLARLGQDDEAKAALEHVLELAPDHLEALRDLGDLAAFQGDVGAAVARYERVLALDPGDAGAAKKLDALRASATPVGGRP
jgi:choline-sulfatase